MTAGTITKPTPVGEAAGGRRTVRGRSAVAALSALGWLLRRLPHRPLHRLAMALGRVLYVLQPGRRRLVRDNLAHVCDWLAGQGLATPAVAAAASDRRALDGLTRAAFGHYLRAYLESLSVERYAPAAIAEQIVADDQELADDVFGPPAGRGRPLLLVGLHFGAIEIPALWAVGHGMALTSPMETIDDPDLQAFLLRRRGASGLSLIPLAGAHHELSARLAAGEAVALVADRLVAGSGARVELFGRPARLPIGPAVLALESGVPAWAVAVRRTGAGQYRARLESIELPADGTRRERLAGFMANQARAFERLVGDAPEQWWTLFFPIWERR